MHVGMGVSLVWKGMVAVSTCRALARCSVLSLTMEGSVGMSHTCALPSEQALCRRTVRRRVWTGRGSGRMRGRQEQ